MFVPTDIIILKKEAQEPLSVEAPLYDCFVDIFKLFHMAGINYLDLCLPLFKTRTFTPEMSKRALLENVQLMKLILLLMHLFGIYPSKLNKRFP